MMPKLINQLGSLGAVECNVLIKLPIIFLLKSIKSMAEAYPVPVKCVGSQLSGIMDWRDTPWTRGKAWAVKVLGE